MYRHLTVLFPAIAAPGFALAQGFITPVDRVPTSEGSYVLLEDGRRFEGKVTTYLVVRDGQKAFVIKKKGYEEQFVEVFGDCESFREFPGKPSFDDFAGHVFVYDQACKAKGNEPG